MKTLGWLFGLLAANLLVIGVYVGIGAALGWVAQWMVGSSHFGDWYRYGGAAGFVYASVQCIRATAQILTEGANK